MSQESFILQRNLPEKVWGRNNIEKRKWWWDAIFVINGFLCQERGENEKEAAKFLCLSYFSTIPNDFSFNLHSVFSKIKWSGWGRWNIGDKKTHTVSPAQQIGNEFISANILANWKEFLFPYSPGSVMFILSTVSHLILCRRVERKKKVILINNSLYS